MARYEYVYWDRLGIRIQRLKTQTLRAQLRKAAEKMGPSSSKTIKENELTQKGVDFHE